MKVKKHIILMILTPIALGGFLVANNVQKDSSDTHGSDLIVSRITVSRTAEDIAGVYGKKYMVAVIIKNIGTVPVSHPFNITINAPGYENDVQRTNRKFAPKWGGSWIEGGKVLMPGEEIGGAWLYPVYLKELGTIYEVNAVVDSSSEISESDENNNGLTKHFTLYTEYGDLLNVKAVD